MVILLTAVPFNVNVALHIASFIDTFVANLEWS